MTYLKPSKRSRALSERPGSMEACPCACDAPSPACHSPVASHVARANHDSFSGTSRCCQRLLIQTRPTHATLRQNLPEAIMTSATCTSTQAVHRCLGCLSARAIWLRVPALRARCPTAWRLDTALDDYLVPSNCISASGCAVALSVADARFAAILHAPAEREPQRVPSAFEPSHTDCDGGDGLPRSCPGPRHAGPAGALPRLRPCHGPAGSRQVRCGSGGGVPAATRPPAGAQAALARHARCVSAGAAGSRGRRGALRRVKCARPRTSILVASCGCVDDERNNHRGS